jgi:hypothetical protein
VGPFREFDLGDQAGFNEGRLPADLGWEWRLGSERRGVAGQRAQCFFQPLQLRGGEPGAHPPGVAQLLGSAAGEAWEALARDLERGLAQLESEVAVARANLEAELAGTRQSYLEALRYQLDAWRGRVEHLRVQAALAEMEARDELDELLERVDNAYRAARQQLDKAEIDTAQTLQVLRAGARRVLNDVEMAVDAARKRLAADRTA